MIIIAQQQPDGVIRYVSVPKFYNYDLPHILRNFYPKESRVSALIDLGNLVTLRPTPFGKPRDYTTKCTAVHGFAMTRRRKADISRDTPIRKRTC